MVYKIAVDCLIIAYDNQQQELKILLVKRENEPEKGSWALPGGFMSQAEEFVVTAKKILEKETGASDIYLEQLQAYGLTGSTANSRIASVAYYALIKLEEYAPTAAASHLAQWFSLRAIPELPFDHSQKVADVLKRIKETVRIKPLMFELLPFKFPLNQLQKFYEALYGVALDNRNFRKKIKKMPFIEEIDELETNVSHRPGKLYVFNRSLYERQPAYLLF